ncbi:hypothetical protein BKA63DRAFT_487278 [Paraphoma chrysanthemicola]|nr:hypothetical protein BKA63DRAFT_487278 [Paraphoma chrysanthemicola]
MSSCSGPAGWLCLMHMQPWALALYLELQMMIKVWLARTAEEVLHVAPVHTCRVTVEDNLVHQSTGPVDLRASADGNSATRLIFFTTSVYFGLYGFTRSNKRAHHSGLSLTKRVPLHMRSAANLKTANSGTAWHMRDACYVLVKFRFSNVPHRTTWAIQVDLLQVKAPPWLHRMGPL